MACAADGAVGCAHLLAAWYPSQRRAEPGEPPVYPCLDDARPVAGSGANRDDAEPAPQCLARGDDPLHAVACRRLEPRGLWRLPGWRPRTAAAAGDLPSGDYRDAVPAALEAARRGARRDAGDLARYRVLGAVFLVNWARGAAPGIFALPAGIGDVITGLLAVPAAIALGTGSAEGRRAAIAW